MYKNLHKNIFLTSKNFDDFTLARKTHFNHFKNHQLDLDFFSHTVDPDNCMLKCYTDLLVYSFIKKYIPKGSRILEVGGGNSRILAYFKNDYECWNIDRMEGVGNGPQDSEKNQTGIKLVKDYTGNFSTELPDQYFDFVFSISALEHTPQNDPLLFDRIIDDIKRLMKIDSFGLHCFDVILSSRPGIENRMNRIINRFFERFNTLNSYLPLDSITDNSDIYCLCKGFYDKGWKKLTQKEYDDYGYPTSYQIFIKNTVK